MRKPLVLAALGAALFFLRPVPADAQTVTKAYTDRCAGSQFGGPVVLASSSVTVTSGGSGAFVGYTFQADPAVAVGSNPAHWFRQTAVRTGTSSQGLWGVQFWNQASGGTARDYGSATTPTSVRVVLIPSTGTGVHWEFTVADAPYGTIFGFNGNRPTASTNYLSAAQGTALAASGSWQVMLLDTSVSGQTWSSNGQFTTLPSWTASTAGCLPAVLGAPTLANPPAGGYSTGDIITVEMVFSRQVSVGTAPSVFLDIGGDVVEGTCSLAADGVTFSCGFLVQASHEDTDGISIQAAATLTGFDGMPSGDSAVTAMVPATPFTQTVNQPATTGPSTPAPTGSLSRVAGVAVRPIPGGLAVSWSPASGPVTQYRVDAAPLGSASSLDAGARDLAAGHRRVYVDANVLEAEVDGLVDGAEYQVTVTALGAVPGEEGPASEPVRRTAGASGDPGSGEDEEEPVPALPLAGAAALAAAPPAGGATRAAGADGSARQASPRGSAWRPT